MSKVTSCFQVTSEVCGVVVLKRQPVSAQRLEPTGEPRLQPARVLDRSYGLVLKIGTNLGERGC